MPKVELVAGKSGRVGRPPLLRITRRVLKSPRNSWQTQTSAASASWAAGVQAAISKGSFAKGVSRRAIQMGEGRGWQGRGPLRGRGRGCASRLRERGGSVFVGDRNHCSPARGPKGRAQNIQRVSVLAAALHAKKVADSAGRIGGAPPPEPPGLTNEIPLQRGAGRKP